MAANHMRGEGTYLLPAGCHSRYGPPPKQWVLHQLPRHVKAGFPAVRRRLCTHEQVDGLGQRVGVGVDIKGAGVDGKGFGVDGKGVRVGAREFCGGHALALGRTPPIHPPLPLVHHLAELAHRDASLQLPNVEPQSRLQQASIT